MDKKQNHSVVPFFIFAVSVFFLIFGLNFIGVFSSTKYFVKVEATTGPDFWVVLGELKLKFQMPDTIVHQDCGGIMVDNSDLREIFKATHEDGISFEWDYYYTLTGEVVGVERSDGIAFHPLVKVTSSRRIGKLQFWVLAVADITALIFFGLYSLKSSPEAI